MFRGIIFKKLLPDVSEEPQTVFLMLNDFFYSLEENKSFTKDFKAKINYIVLANKTIFDYIKIVNYFKSEFLKSQENINKLKTYEVHNYIYEISKELAGYTIVLDAAHMDIALPKKIEDYNSYGDELEQDIYKFISEHINLAGGEFVDFYTEDENDFYNRCIKNYVDEADKILNEVKVKEEKLAADLKKKTKVIEGKGK
jgi:hypothetical protein